MCNHCIWAFPRAGLPRAPRPLVLSCPPHLLPSLPCCRLAPSNHRGRPPCSPTHRQRSQMWWSPPTFSPLSQRSSYPVSSSPGSVVLPTALSRTCKASWTQEGSSRTPPWRWLWRPPPPPPPSSPGPAPPLAGWTPPTPQSRHILPRQWLSVIFLKAATSTSTTLLVHATTHQSQCRETWPDYKRQLRKTKCSQARWPLWNPPGPTCPPSTATSRSLPRRFPAELIICQARYWTCRGNKMESSVL